MPSVLAPTRALGVPLAADLRIHGANVAIVSDGERLTYDALADRVDAVAHELFADERRLVLLAPRNDVDSVVHLLGALATSNPVLLVPGDDPAKLKHWAMTYDPDVVITSIAGALHVEERRATSAHDLHPDLALLVSTSGSTGSPKLVRLSGDNVQVNAEQIADGLGITALDRAITTLPPAYVFGLSVLTSHLLRGAGIVLNEASVVDPCFWDRAERSCVTSFAGVPYTFELLERLDIDAHLDRLPQLRQITQAGGRLPAAAVARWVTRALDRGFDFTVMYGQSEATARMCIARTPTLIDNPSCVGRPVAGAHVRIDVTAPEGASTRTPTAARSHGVDVGELVFTGRNVMLGYAETAADLALGRTTDELRTGDLATIDPQGRIEIVGRARRFAKVLGLRIDLQRLEDTLQCAALELHALSDDRTITMLIAPTPQTARSTPPPDTAEITRRAVAATGLPPGAFQVLFVEALPRTSAGKVDGAAAQELAATMAARHARDAIDGSPSLGTPATADGLRALMAQRLHRPDATLDDSFVSLGGDSLSYVELSVALESALGTLPDGWQHRTIRELAARAASDSPSTARRGAFALRRVDSTIVLRALAIVAIVGSHIEAFDFRGGAHLLVAIVGYNLARFQLIDVERRARVRRMCSAIATVAVPGVLWLLAYVVLSDRVEWPSAVLMNTLVGSVDWTPAWQFWFIEALIYLLVGVTLLLAMPWFDRAERRWPFALPLALLAVGLLARYDVFVGETGKMHLFTPASVAWLLALGWAIQRGPAWWQRALLTAIALITVPGFSANPDRVHFVLVGLLVLIWLPSVRVPSRVVRPLAVIASASLWIYLTHWAVFPPLRSTSDWLALVACIVVGIAASMAWNLVDARARSAWRKRQANEVERARPLVQSTV